jgi:integrase
VSKSFAGLIRRLGIPPVRFHDLRHTHATMLLRKGVHPKVVQERLGHSQISITLDTYSHVLPGLQDEAAAKVDELLENPSP